tara:strand:+ start:207 stop:464 length:258 start_codon:yes stop_codon:yes gene_type:complete
MECFGVFIGTWFSLLSDIRSQQTSSSLHDRRNKGLKFKTVFLVGAVFFCNAFKLPYLTVENRNQILSINYLLKNNKKRINYFKNI